MARHDERPVADFSGVDPITASCNRKYRAVHTSGTRHVRDIWWIVLHDEEAPTAESAASYFTHNDSGGSAHLCVDDQTCFRTLRNDQIPWGASSAPQLQANFHGFHVEQAGYAKWLPGQWRLHPRTIERAAYKTALHLVEFRIPTIWVTEDMLVDGVRHGRLPHGITTHRIISAASKRLDPANAWRYTHSDPGRFYPQKRFMSLTRQYHDQIERGT